MYELEEAADILSANVSETEELLLRIKKVSDEICTDPDLMVLPQHEVISQALAECRESVGRFFEMLQDLSRIMLTVPAEYKEDEKAAVDALSRMNAVLSELSACLIASASPAVTCVEQSDVYRSHEHLSEMVSGNALEMQITNIAAVTNQIEKEYRTTDSVSIGNDQEEG